MGSSMVGKIKNHEYRFIKASAMLRLLKKKKVNVLIKVDEIIEKRIYECIRYK